MQANIKLTSVQRSFCKALRMRAMAEDICVRSIKLVPEMGNYPPQSKGRMNEEAIAMAIATVPTQGQAYPGNQQVQQGRTGAHLFTFGHEYF